MTTPTDRLSAALSGRYRIERELGAGGMATVYLAEDLKHDRKVAIKVLKPELAAVLGADRFVVEIKTTASLQHPHILALFDSGTADGFLFYVMPYVQGETIREKLNRETQFGVEEAVRIAREVADALDYAHRHGVIHRDIKPENILLHDGRAIVMDFGIALAVSAAAGGRMTETGLSLGTPHYMSPEQATAEKEITPRSDVYSLGSVLYEMLAGQPPHIGGAAQQVIMKIIAEPVQPVTAHRKSVPANVASALAKALEKLPADRFASARDFAQALQDERFTHGGAATAGGIASSRGAMFARGALAAGAALALIGAALATWALLQRPDHGPAPASVHLTLDLPGANPDGTRFAVSADGGSFAFANDEGIVVRDAGQREYRLLTGTRGAESPAFSPEGDWIAYGTRGLLRKIAVRGGSSVSLVAGDSVRTGRLDWGQDGSIVFESGNQLYLIAMEGEPPRRLAATMGAQSPRLLPDGSGVLYVDHRSGSRLMFHDRRTDTSYAILEESSEGQYVATGHIVYAHPNGGLFAIRFDRDRRTTVGVPAPLLSDLQPNGSVAAFRVAPSGALVYRAGLDPEARIMVWRHGGRVDTLPLGPRILSYARFSPDGRSIALAIGSARGVNRHTAIYDIDRGALTQFTFEGGGHAPVWSPDGSRLAFTAEAEGAEAEDLFVQPLDRSAPPRRILRMPDDQHATAWPEDSILVFSTANTPRADVAASGDVFVVDPVAPNAAARGFLTAPWAEADVAVSPDGRAAAYTSNESGAQEVYVRPFRDAATGGQLKVSAAGGRSARWSPDGRTVYYHGLDGRTIHATRLSAGPPYTVLSREVILSVPRLGQAWDVDRRTGRIVFVQAVPMEGTEMIVITNWLDRLRRLDTDRP